MAQRSSDFHKCVFCSQNFPSKPELQTHFRLHANGEIDIKGRPRVRLKPASEHTGSDSSGGREGNKKKRKNDDDDDDDDGGEATDDDGVNNAVCDVCGEVFRTVSLAISHKFRKHPNSLLKYYCPHCGMMFPIKLNRDKHLLTHSSSPSNRVYPCRSCGVAFYNHRAKKFHMDSAHKGAIRLVNPIRTPAPSMKVVLNNAGQAHSVYYCHLCGCEYQLKYNLQKHLASKHSQAERDATPQELVQCNLCSGVFYSKRAYQTHSHHHREGDLFATSEQMRQQVVQRIDQDFDQRRVPSVLEKRFAAAAAAASRSQAWRKLQTIKRNSEAAVAEDGGSSSEDTNGKIRRVGDVDSEARSDVDSVNSESGDLSCKMKSVDSESKDMNSGERDAETRMDSVDSKNKSVNSEVRKVDSENSYVNTGTRTVECGSIRVDSVTGSISSSEVSSVNSDDTNANNEIDNVNKEFIKKLTNETAGNINNEINDTNNGTRNINGKTKNINTKTRKSNTKARKAKSKATTNAESETGRNLTHARNGSSETLNVNEECITNCTDHTISHVNSNPTASQVNFSVIPTTSIINPHGKPTETEERIMGKDYMCWDEETEGSKRRRKRMEDLEEEDEEGMSLGTVNPDHVLSRGAARGRNGCRRGRGRRKMRKEMSR